MTASFQMQSFYRTTPLTVDTSQKYFEDEDTSNNTNNNNSSSSHMLEDNILDNSGIDSGLDMSPPMADSRRESFAVGSSLFSPKTEAWESVDMQSLPSNSGYSEQAGPTTNPFMQSQQTAFGTQGASWSGSCTPLPQFDGLPGDFNGGASIFQQGQPFGNSGVNIFSGLNGGNGSMPTSPQKEWANGQKKMENGQIRSHNELRRGDGIRKKNARFDIPAERNLGNIDQLISQSTDEQEIKELKQQKRLLRNRQAALDSRQRKKQHTERLEDEKKQYTAIINDMEEELNELRARVAGLLRDRQGYQECVETMRLEKEELIRAHTLESAELRKKMGAMGDHINRLESSSMNNMAAANDFNGGFDNPMGGMGMPGAWDNVSYLHDFSMEPEIKQETQVVATKKSELTLPSDDKANTQGGLLFMLFLVGAFVMSTRSTPNFNQVPEDMRAASATILDNVLKDAGVSGVSPSSGGGMENVVPAAPQPSGPSWSNMDMTGMQLGGSNGPASMLGDLADSLTQPTQEQTNAQIFSLSAAQYNGVTSQEFMQTPPERTTSQGRRNLAEALAAMRNNNNNNNNNNKQSASEVYTRSLLWDQIPSEVVKSFAKMVAECKNAQNEQQQCNTATS